MFRFLRYQGSKEHIIDIVNKLVLVNNQYKVYIEPFVGSGTIFINLPDIFEKYIINDVDENVMVMWHAIKEYEYDSYTQAHKFILDTFGDIKENKESYYAFRDYYNKEHHFKRTSLKGIYLSFLTNSCINSMLRFGPNGMNQGWGNRLYLMTEYDFNVIKNKLRKTILKNTDYKEIIRGQHNSLIYLDPPYFKRQTSYKQNFEEKDLTNLIEIISYLNDQNSIIYSDIETDISNSLLKMNFKKIDAKEMRNISPLRTSEFIDESEVLYHNLKSKFFI